MNKIIRWYLNNLLPDKSVNKATWSQWRIWLPHILTYYGTLAFVVAVSYVAVLFLNIVQLILFVLFALLIFIYLLEQCFILDEEQEKLKNVKFHVFYHLVLILKIFRLMKLLIL